MALKLKERNITKTITATKATYKAFDRESKKPVTAEITLDGLKNDDEILNELKKRGILAYSVLSTSRIDSLLKMSERTFMAYGAVTDKIVQGDINRTIDLVTATIEYFDTETEELRQGVFSIFGYVNPVTEELIETIIKNTSESYMLVNVVSLVEEHNLYHMPIDTFIKYATKA